MGPVISDSGNILADLVEYSRDIEITDLAAILDSTTGVVEHGIFMNLCHEAVIAKDDASVYSLVRK
jgi:ribose 5-phosphate isomerase A